MQNYRAIVIIGIIEVTIGVSAFIANITFLVFGTNAKSINVLFFVLTAAAISTLLGIGILRLNRIAYKLLLYFSTVIILSKLLIMMDIIRLNGELEVSIHNAVGMPVSEEFRAMMNTLKNLISMAYHGVLIYILKRPTMKKIFIR